MGGPKVLVPGALPVGMPQHDQSKSSNSSQQSGNQSRNARTNNQQQQQPKRKRLRKKKTTPVQTIPIAAPVGMQTSNVLALPASEYIRALANPWTGPLASIPTSPALLTARYRIWSKGSFATSNNAAAGGFGYIIFDPNWSTANDRGCVIYNSVSATVTAITTTISGTQGTDTVSNSPYKTSDYSSNGKQYRIVAAGLKISPTSPAISRGGLIVGLHNPAHTSLDTVTVNVMDSFEESGRFANNTSTPKLLYRPVDTTDYNFQYTYQPAGVGQKSWYMGFIIAAPDTTGAVVQQFEYEAFTVFEVQGPDIQSKVASHVDSVGHGAAETVTVIAKKMHRPHIEDSTVIEKAAHDAAEDIVRHKTSGNKSSSKPKKDPSHDFWDTILDVGEGVLGGMLGSLF